MSSLLGSGVGGSAAPTRSRAAAQRNGTPLMSEIGAAHHVAAPICQQMTSFFGITAPPRACDGIANSVTGSALLRQCRPRQIKGLAEPTPSGRRTFETECMPSVTPSRRCRRTGSRVDGRADWQKRRAENLDLPIANAVPCYHITKRAALQ